jgi:hypothetical protein
MLSKKVPIVVTPAKAGVQNFLSFLDSRFHGNDRKAGFRAFCDDIILHHSKFLVRHSIFSSRPLDQGGIRLQGNVSIEKGRRMKRVGLLLLLSFLLAGCGYHFRADGEPVGIQLESLAIPLFSSTSSEIGFEANFTKVIRQEFISNGRVPLVPEEKAQVVLIGKIQEIRADPLTYMSKDVTVGGNTSTYEVTRSRKLRVRLDVQLLDRRQGKIIWREAAMEEQDSYAVSGDPLETRYTEQKALERIASRLARRIYLRTMERF